ncbi:MAG: hypothetical protein PHP52_05495 [Bacteroidales bacterium]|nr:hypothetical protein [Bacteroidales bacterium]MDD4216847.1 hypothetical protein [Bacteroidales bacterium]MDY0142258.1 hypothetical protein [Bacteroidales bacterium]
MKRFKLYLMFSIALLGIFSCTQKIDTTEKLFQEIANKYNGKWFKQVKFMQTTNFYRSDTVYKSERWVEEYVFPGQLIIKVNGDFEQDDGFLYRNDSVYIYENNEITDSHKITHDLLILSMDIYNMSANDALERFSELDYDISKYEARTCNGRKVYVVGAENGDTISNQVWYDAEYLYLIKMIKNTSEGYHEVFLNDYININGSAWIEQEVVFKLNGEKYMVEKYFDIRIPDEKRTEINVNDFNIRFFNPLELLPDLIYAETIMFFLKFLNLSKSG